MKGSEVDEEERGDEKRESERRILMTARTQTHAYQNIILMGVGHFRYVLAVD